MGVNFDKLNSLAHRATETAKNSPAASSPINTPIKTESHLKSDLDTLEEKTAPTEETEVSNKLQIEADRAGNEIATARAVYGKYQQAILASEQLTAQIMKAVNEGNTDYKTLFLQACEVVSLTTANSVFYSHIKNKLQ